MSHPLYQQSLKYQEVKPTILIRNLKYTVVQIIIYVFIFTIASLDFCHATDLWLHKSVFRYNINIVVSLAILLPWSLLSFSFYYSLLEILSYITCINQIKKKWFYHIYNKMYTQAFKLILLNLNNNHISCLLWQCSNYLWHEVSWYEVSMVRNLHNSILSLFWIGPVTFQAQLAVRQE